MWLFWRARGGGYYTLSPSQGCLGEDRCKATTGNPKEPEESSVSLREEGQGGDDRGLQGRPGQDTRQGSPGPVLVLTVFVMLSHFFFLGNIFFSHLQNKGCGQFLGSLPGLHLVSIIPAVERMGQIPKTTPLPRTSGTNNYTRKREAEGALPTGLGARKHFC